MDWQAVETFLLVREAKSPSTVHEMVRRFRRMEREGLDTVAFAASRDGAQKAGDSHLAWVRKKGKTWEYANCVRNMNALARFAGWDALTWPMPPQPRSMPKAYTPEQMQRILSLPQSRNLEKRRRRALAVWAMYSGMRRSEVAAMDVSDVDLSAATFLVRKPAKLGLQRRLPIEPEVLSPRRAFRAYLNRRLAPKEDPGALWTKMTARGPQRMSGAELAQELWAAGKACGVPLNFMRTRHTRATMLLRAGMDIRYIQVYLGHAALKTTAVYAQATPEDLESVLRSIRTPSPVSRRQRSK